MIKIKIRPTITILALALASVTCFAGEIAFTFDDSPTHGSTLMSGQERTRLIIKQLKAANVSDALFFCTTKHIDDEGKRRLRTYVENGHHLANHSHSHLSASKISHQEYLEDLSHADEQLRKHPGFLPFHRFPYLHYGADLEAITALQKSIGEKGYRDGYVTVDTSDWYLNHLMVEAAEQGRAVNTPAIRDLYVSMLWNSIKFYDDLAKRTLGRSPRHVLLLHENDAAALFVGDLVAKLRAEGWSIVSAQQAYNDPIAKDFPKVAFHKQGRIASLAHQTGTPVEELKSPSENLDVIKLKFDSALRPALEPTP